MNKLNKVIVALVASALTFTSCKKPIDDVVPKTVTAPSLNVKTSSTNNDVTITASLTNMTGKVEFIKNGKIEFEDVSAPYEYALTNLPNGVYTYTVKAISYDNKDSLSGTVTFTVNMVSKNSAPVFIDNALTVSSDTTPRVVNIASLVKDAENDNIKIVSISPNTNISNINGTSFTYTPSDKIFASTLDLTISITDGKDTTTSPFFLHIGTASQITTYDILKPYFNKYLATMIVSPNGTMNGANDADFYEAATDKATYTILKNGNILLICLGTKMEYSVKDIQGIGLDFTLVSTTKTNRQSMIGTSFTFVFPYARLQH